jgi:hypothetical protein
MIDRPRFILESGGLAILNIGRAPYVYGQELSMTPDVALTKAHLDVDYIVLE